MVTSPYTDIVETVEKMWGQVWESAWGEWGSVLGYRGSCGKRYMGGCGGRCRGVCWGVGGGKERCVRSGEVWGGVRESA